VIDLQLIEYSFGNVELLWITCSLILGPVIPDGRVWSAFVGSLGYVGDRDALVTPSLANSAVRYSLYVFNLQHTLDSLADNAL
jgi:hypothetical protein